MILVDQSQIISAAILVEGECKECAKNPSTQSKKMIKHYVFNSIRANFMAQKNKFGKMVIACDSGSWRYDVFEQYKYTRKLKMAADTSGINWDFVSEVKSELIDELDRFFPFSVIKVPKVEGDDVIGVLVKHISEQAVMGEENIFGEVEPENILIISSDRDNFQTHKYKNVRQWSPMDKKFIKPIGPIHEFLLEKIVKGDKGDGVMNIRMGDNTFVDGVRQKPISQEYLDKFFAAASPIDVCLTEEEKKNFKRNERLVSYEMIPKEIQDSIISCYNTQLEKKHSKMGFFNYLSANRMVNLQAAIHDFY